MINDPLVEEIHQVRAKLLADCQGHLDELLDRYKSSEDQDRDRVVTLKDVRERRQTDPTTHPTRR
jgi:hypothetical protein